MTPMEIRALRQRLKMTQAEFAARVGVGVKAVNNWEGGKVEPRRLALLRLNQIQRQVDMPAAVGVEV